MKGNSIVLQSASLEIDAIVDLGEGAIWNHLKNELYWIDIEQGLVFIYNPLLEKMRTISVKQRIGSIVPTTKSDHVLVALQDGIYTLNLTTEELQLLAKTPYNSAKIRFNDGKCDPHGRFWVGTMALDTKPQAAALYRFSEETGIQQVLEGVTISNGICWSADKTTMYYIDTPTKVIMAYDYDDPTGDISNGKVVAEIHETDASPDGMAIDKEGKLWVALHGGSSLACYDPETGRLISRIAVPAKNVTSCAFGGHELDTLFITTSSRAMNKLEKLNYPKAGAVFSVVPGVKGVRANFFRCREN